MTLQEWAERYLAEPDSTKRGEIWHAATEDLGVGSGRYWEFYRLVEKGHRA